MSNTNINMQPTNNSAELLKVVEAHIQSEMSKCNRSDKEIELVVEHYTGDRWGRFDDVIEKTLPTPAGMPDDLIIAKLKPNKVNAFEPIWLIGWLDYDDDGSSSGTDRILFSGIRENSRKMIDGAVQTLYNEWLERKAKLESLNQLLEYTKSIIK
jgi:hypothetical protein